jgi:hypothetical protein
VSANSCCETIPNARRQTTRHQHMRNRLSTE